METNDIIERLDYIKNSIENEEYEKVIVCIEKMKYELFKKQNVTSEYMDKLINQLKWKSKYVE